MTVPSDEDIARAQSLGRLTARDGGNVTSCPYPQTTPQGRVLAHRWLKAFMDAGGSTGIKYTE